MSRELSGILAVVTAVCIIVVPAIVGKYCALPEIFPSSVFGNWIWGAFIIADIMGALWIVICLMKALYEGYRNI